MRKIKISSGIQKKYLKYTIALLLLALFLSDIGVFIYMRNNFTQTIIEKYEFADEKMGLALDHLYQQSEEVTAEAIFNNNVQKTLRMLEMNEVEKIAVSKYFSYLDFENVADYCYVDNKDNVYTRSYSTIDYKDVRNSRFDEKLGEDYARTVWFWTEDTLFGTGEKALFIGRYVHSMEYAHEPGMLFLKMEDTFLSDIIEDSTDGKDESITGIMDASGEVCVCLPKGMELPEKISKSVGELKYSDNGKVTEHMRTASGEVISAYRQKDSGLTVFTYVPGKVINKEMAKIFMVIFTLYLVVIIVAIIISMWFSGRFTGPIKGLTEAMASFDGKDFTRIPELYTHTEVDQIGHSYNEMLGNIERLVEEIKEQEKQLHASELNVLISQINPHFLYNTLDTIYMLARINKEETTMKMIEALSKYLRLSLSKGGDIVTLEDELENVRNYMEIQQIRNANLFRYEISCRVDEKHTHVIKMILQPLVENAIKYGFCNVFEGGYIKISVYKEEKQLVLEVYNNGTPMDEAMSDKIRNMRNQPVTKLKECMPDKEHGYGVVNILSRLRLFYGEVIEFYYEVEAEGTRCVIKIPGGER